MSVHEMPVRRNGSPKVKTRERQPIDHVNDQIMKRSSGGGPGKRAIERRRRKNRRGRGLTVLRAQRRKTPQIAQKDIAALNAFTRPRLPMSDAAAAGPNPFPKSSCEWPAREQLRAQTLRFAAAGGTLS